MTKKEVIGGWVFRVEVVSDKMVLTKDAIVELQRLLYSSEVFGNWKITELYEDIDILNVKKENIYKRKELR